MTAMNKPRKYKAKPPISQLDDAAAKHRREQSCKAQRAYRQRKEDTISTLTAQIADLEGVIGKLSSCFLGLNDKILAHLNHQSHPALAASIRDSMREFKSIIDKPETDDIAPEDSNENTKDDDQAQTALTPQSLKSTHGNYAINASPSQQCIPDFADYTNYSALPTIQLPPSPSLSTIFAGPSFSDLTPMNRSVPNAQEALARRIYVTTARMAYQLALTMPVSAPVFQRVFESFCARYPPDQVREVVLDMLQRNNWNLHDERRRGKNFMSAVEVAEYCVNHGLQYVAEMDKIIVASPLNGVGYVMLDVDKFVDDILIEGKCEDDAPAYLRLSVAKAVMVARS